MIRYFKVRSKMEFDRTIYGPLGLFIGKENFIKKHSEGLELYCITLGRSLTISEKEFDEHFEISEEVTVGSSKAHLDLKFNRTLLKLYSESLKEFKDRVRNSKDPSEISKTSLSINKFRKLVNELLQINSQLKDVISKEIVSRRNEPYESY